MIRDPDPPAAAALWRELTAARVALGRCGAGMPTRAVLAFQADHARARDAVHDALDERLLIDQLTGFETICVASQAADRSAYLHRPDLGRRLDPRHAEALSPGDYDLAFVVADGLSATAAHRNAAGVIGAVVACVGPLRLAPIVLARQARVALGDEIGDRLRARAVVVLIGERPGLSASDSLGAYITLNPAVGRRDSERNCVSNIRPGGLGVEEAGARISWLLEAALRLGATGVGLKDGYPGLGAAALAAKLATPQNVG